jgi:hypothetical protein
MWFDFLTIGPGKASCLSAMSDLPSGRLVVIGWDGCWRTFPAFFLSSILGSLTSVNSVSGGNLSDEVGNLSDEVGNLSDEVGNLSE